MVAILGLCALGLAAWRSRDPATLWLFAAGCTLAAGCYSAALTHGQPATLLRWLGGRYTFASSVLLSLSLLGLACTGPFRRRAIPFALVVLMLYQGLTQYFQVPGSIADGVNWLNEVAIWRHDPTYQLHMWPLGWGPELTLDPVWRPNE